MENKKIIGLTEKIKIKNKDNEKQIEARIDTGATISSIDAQLAAEMSLGPLIKTKKVKSSHGMSVRPVVKATIVLKGVEITGNFTIADREHMKYDMLIGQNILKKGFLVDTTK